MRKYREFLIIATLCVSAGCAAMYFLYTLKNN